MREPKKNTSKDRAALFIKAALEALHAAGGSLPLREVKAAVAAKVSFTPDDLRVYEKTGYVRWESILHFYSIDCVKAGFILKHGGQWHLTPEGEAVLALPAADLLDQALRAYRQWKANRPAEVDAPTKDSAPDVPISAFEQAAVERSFVFERAEADARAEIEDFLANLGPYELQDVVAALLRGMGYTTPFIAPKGPDGGTDILAYPDPLGARTPHIRVQVKHRARSGQKATRDEIASLRGILRQDREMGLFVSTAGFTSEAVREARQGGVHIDLMDLNGLLEKWTSFYDRLTEEDKGSLRLRRVFFLAPE